MEYEQEVLPTAGVVFEGSLIPSFVSDVNMPIGGSIGEYQVDIFKNDITIDHSIIGCQANNCHVECKMSVPVIERLIKSSSRHDLRKVSRVLSNGNTIENKAECNGLYWECSV